MVPSCGDRRWRAGNEFSRVTIDPTQFHLIPMARRFITQRLFTGHLATVDDCTSPVFRCSEITSSLRARAMRMVAEMRPSPGRFK